MIKNILTSTLTAIIVSTLALSFIPVKDQTAGNKSVFGNQIETVLVWLGGGVRVGTNGNNITKVIASTCNLIIGKTSQTGSTTLPYDCLINGARPNDTIIGQLATSTVGSTILGWNIGSVKASTTPNYVTVFLENRTGTSANPSSTSVGSSTRIYILDN